MRRRLFNILSAISLLVCLAAIAVTLVNCLVAHDFVDRLLLRSAVVPLTAILPCCWLWLYRRSRGKSMSRRMFKILSVLSLLLFLLTAVYLLRALLIASLGGSLWEERDIWLFALFFLLLFSILPVRGIIREARDERVRQCLQQRICHKCGYDLRASKDRCPECGTPIPVQTAGSEKV